MVSEVWGHNASARVSAYSASILSLLALLSQLCLVGIAHVCAQLPLALSMPWHMCVHTTARQVNQLVLRSWEVNSMVLISESRADLQGCYCSLSSASLAFLELRMYARSCHSLSACA